MFLCGNVSSSVWNPLIHPTELLLPRYAFRATLHNAILSTNDEGFWIDEELKRTDLKNARISTGGSNHYFVGSEGFGRNSHGQCSRPACTVAGDIACGWESSAAIEAESSALLLWGRTEDFLSPDDLNSRGEVKPFLNVGRLAKIVLGFSHGIVLTAEGETFAFGFINKQKVGFRKVGSNIVDVATGSSHGVLLDARGQVFCFGSAGDGKLGIEGATDSLVPLHVVIPEPIRKIAAGCDHTVVIDEQGSGKKRTEKKIRFVLRQEQLSLGDL